MIDPAAIAAAYTGINAAKDLFTGYLSNKAKQMSEEQVREALDQLGSVHNTLFNLREELFRLQDENRGLTKQIDGMRRWEEKAGKYKLVRTLRNNFVYKSEFEPIHYVCPSCFDGEHIQILQDTNTYAGAYVCPKCKSTFDIEQMRNAEPNSFE